MGRAVNAVNAVNGTWTTRGWGQRCLDAKTDSHPSNARLRDGKAQTRHPRNAPRLPDRNYVIGSPPVLSPFGVQGKPDRDWIHVALTGLFVRARGIQKLTISHCVVEAHGQLSEDDLRCKVLLESRLLVAQVVRFTKRTAKVWKPNLAFQLVEPRQRDFQFQVEVSGAQLAHAQRDFSLTGCSHVSMIEQCQKTLRIRSRRGDSSSPGFLQSMRQPNSLGKFSFLKTRSAADRTHADIKAWHAMEAEMVIRQNSYSHVNAVGGLIW